jgi:hypothetical protein
MTERDRAARRRLVWLLLTRGDVGAEHLRSDGLPALRPPPAPEPRGIGAAEHAADPTCAGRGPDPAGAVIPT